MRAGNGVRIGVISNPGSQRNKQGLSEIARLIEAAPEARHAVLDSIADLPGVLTDFARREVDVVIVAGGDGTVQAVLTELYTRRPFAQEPLLAVVPRGMTNMIAADVGLKGMKGLARLLKASPDEIDRATRRRRILRAENALNCEPQYGMFFGGAGICRAIDACLNKVHPLKVEADAAVAVTLAGLLGGWLLHGGRKENGKTDSIFYGDRIGMRFNGGPEETMESLIILATTLDKLILGSRPFWGGREGHLRYTAIAYPPKGLLRYALRILYGGTERRLPQDSYLSRTVESVALAMDCPFTLDGEMFQPTPGKELVLTTADETRFVRL